MTTRTRPDTAPPVLHAGVGGWAKCKSCKADIVWAHTTAGKRTPFERDDAGEWTIENGVGRHVGPPSKQLDLGAAPLVRFTSHFARCPQAEQWRNRGER